MTRPKDIGTIAETAVVRFLRENGFPHAERRALAGQYDLGDITGTPGVCWEVKAGHVAEAAAGGHLREWQDQTDAEKRNSGSQVGVLILKRKAVGAANAGQWWAYIRTEDLFRLLCPNDSWPPPGAPTAWCRLQLNELVRFIRFAGYGDPL